MSDEDDLFHMYGNAPDRYPFESLPEYDARHSFGPATPYVGDPRVNDNRPYANAPRPAPRPRRTWKERRQSFFGLLLTLAFLGFVGFIGSIDIQAGIVAAIAWMAIAYVIRRRRLGRRRR